MDKMRKSFSSRPQLHGYRRREQLIKLSRNLLDPMIVSSSLAPPRSPDHNRDTARNGFMRRPANPANWNTPNDNGL